MKKKTEKKKLVLAKETVRRLAPGDLGGVVGGTAWWSCPEYTCQNEDDPIATVRC